jgi:hypothetical protein
MAMPALDPKKNWFFHFGSLVPNEEPIKMEEKEGVITFEIFLEPGRIIKIELLKLDEEERIIEGQYSVSPMSCKDPVIFRILENGKLVGRPSGFLERSVWTLTSS